MLKSNYEFEVLVNGHSAREYYHEGRYYIEAKEGTKFSLRMRNNTFSRALFVPTVDGLSILNGKEASFKSRGYIVNGGDSVTIDGWRTSDNAVAEFFFSSPKNSYAKKKDKGLNLGVLGCAVFKERETIPEVIKILKEFAPVQPEPKWWWTTSTYSQDPTIYSYYSSTGPSMLSCSSVTASSSSNKSPEQALGTGFGQEKSSPVVTVSFDKEENPAAIFTIYYNTRENLEAMGVEFKKPVYIAPSAFPNEEGYCERP